jgi:hypothetical protein
MSQPRPSTGGAAVWGGIIGTLTDQADLVAALDAKGNLAGGNAWTGQQSIDGGTVVASTPIINLSQTWNNAGVVFVGANSNITNTASAAGSMIQRWQMDGTTLMSLTKTGRLNLGLPSLGVFNAWIDSDNDGYLRFQTPRINGAFIQAASSTLLQWTNITDATTGTPDTFIGRESAAVVQMGMDHPTTPTAQTFKAHDVTTGIGADLILSGGTGSTADGEVCFGVYTASVIVPDGWIRIKSKSGQFLRIPAYLEP